jgi:hypothetical protein
LGSENIGDPKSLEEEPDAIHLSRWRLRLGSEQAENQGDHEDEQ